MFSALMVAACIVLSHCKIPLGENLSLSVTFLARALCALVCGPVAAVLFHKLPVEGKKVACVISGGNIDVNILNRVITRGLVMSGRKANLTIALEDKPGQLKKVAEVVSRCGSNVVSVQHDGSDPNMPISSCFLKLTLETRDAAQIEQIRTELTKAGLQLVSERV